MKLFDVQAVKKAKIEKLAARISLTTTARIVRMELKHRVITWMANIPQRMWLLSFAVVLVFVFTLYLFSHGKIQMNNKHPFLVEKEPQKPLISLDLLNSLPQRIVYPVPTKTVPSLSVACFAEDIIICKGLQQSGRWEVFDSEEYFLSNLFTRPLDQEYRYFLDFGSNLGLFSLLLASKGNWKGMHIIIMF